MQSRKQVRLSTFERPKQEEIPPQRRPGPSRTSPPTPPPPPHFAGSRWGEKQNAHARLCKQVAYKHSCTCKPCRQSHMLATRKHETCQTLAQVQTCARPHISYAHTSHLDTRMRAPRKTANLVTAMGSSNPAQNSCRQQTRSRNQPTAKEHLQTWH